ncbi:MAG: hypothetical protein IKU44_03515 [Firmicutes bacterium]|nr:hypothetical protein [Bacillota bacterium]
MAEQVILIVDVGGENPEMIKEDVLALGVKAEVCPHNLMTEEEVLAYGDVKGFIFDGGTAKMEGKFRIVAYPIFQEMIDQQRIPSYSVDYAGFEGVDLYGWPADEETRKWRIENFLKTRCKVL